MAYSATGSISSYVNFNAAFTAAAGASPISSYTIPAQAPITYTYSAGTGSAGPLIITKLAAIGGSLATNQAAASIFNLNITSLGIDGAVLGLTHLRELIIFNDGRTAFANTDTDVLNFDTTFAAAFGKNGTAPQPLSVASVISIPAGGFFRLSCPYGSNGWVITPATNTVIALATPASNANTINYRIVIAGDSY